MATRAAQATQATQAAAAKAVALVAAQEAIANPPKVENVFVDGAQEIDYAIAINHVANDAIQLRVFKYSLASKAKAWLHENILLEKFYMGLDSLNQYVANNAAGAVSWTKPQQELLIC
ncbi:hypothetical protein HAX54_037713 [Datura stramonium]|uniref:Uncharacterized protein n=1 Tax=Datura stramonium TaxID=4076 RepID=A0ABS8VKD1_DATST|nr:hypothetical protein [Datura stramonium]